MTPKNHNPEFEVNPIRANIIGLRTEAPRSDVYVYKMNPDGSRGKLKEIVHPKHFIVYTTMLTKKAIAKRMAGNV